MPGSGIIFINPPTLEIHEAQHDPGQPTGADNFLEHLGGKSLIDWEPVLAGHVLHGHILVSGVSFIIEHGCMHEHTGVVLPVPFQVQLLAGVQLALETPPVDVVGGILEGVNFGSLDG